MKLFDKTTKQNLPARIEKVSLKDYKQVKEDNEFRFNWSKEKDFEVYKITLKNDDLILGMMSLEEIPKEYRIHLNLLEVRKEHQENLKKNDFIAGCLIAYAASEATKRGYFGFVSLKSKTELIDWYQNKYGFTQYGLYLGIEGEQSWALIRKYLEYD